MKKLSILLLAVVALLFVGMYQTPEVFAEGEPIKVEMKLNVIQEGLNVPVTIPDLDFGTMVSFSDEDLPVTGEEVALFVKDGELISSGDTPTFLVSGSTNVTVVVKDPAQNVAVFVDTNGELLDVVYDMDETSDLSAITASKPGYQFNPFTAEAITEDTVYIASYTRASEASVQINGQEYNYNDVVTLEPANPTTFGYWADEDGQVVSREPNYQLTALRDVTLTEVASETELQPHVYLYNVTGISEGNYSFVGYIEGNVVEYGVLASTLEEVLTLSNAEEVIPSTSLHPETNEFLRSVPYDLGYKSFRGYARLENGDILYSDNSYFLQEFSDDVITGTSIIKSKGRNADNIGNNASVNSYLDFDNTIETNIDVTFLKNAPSTTSIFGNDSSEIRLYPGSGNGSEIKISVPGSLITKVTVNTSQNPSILSINNEASVGGSPTKEFASGVEEVSLKNVSSQSSGSGNQVRIVDVVVEFETGTSVPEIRTKLLEVTYTIENEKNSTYTRYNEQLTQPEDPFKIGYQFIGWFIEGEETPFDFNVPIKNHLNLIARFEEVGQVLIDVVAEYSGSTTNMHGENNASLINLDSNIFTVTSIQRDPNPLHVGLNANGQIRLYNANNYGNTMIIEIDEAYTITNIKFNFGNTVTSAIIMTQDEVKHNDSLQPNGSLAFEELNINKFSIENTGNSQIYILSIEITYTAK